MAKKRPPANTALRLPPFVRADRDSVVRALESKGESIRQEDLFGVLLARVVGLIANPQELDQLATEIRAHKVRSKAAGF